ncbi:unnamed protein product [Clonostachys rhizophaga]|uniref:non-specific serine/threonine protein kinase n=1 Tax=Clonostachys rhizophaga TaxID=160324 RepID=A0A9N9VV83_9HYPO|nr:unnamed protein product [Clonostachys rhizophaga]
MYKNTRFMGEGPWPYKPGGFHPVHLGDVLDGRYQIFRKLGAGGQSTVWLARDSSKQERSYVAIKVHEAQGGKHQEKIDEYLRQDQTPHPGASYVESSLGSFTVTGPNGTHYCKVMEPYGGSLTRVLNAAFDLRGTLNEGESWTWKAQKGDGWSTAVAKKICWQVLSGLSYLHSRELAHRDIRPTNVFTALQYDLSLLSENDIQESVWPADVKEEEEEEEEEGEEDDDDDEDDDEEEEEYDEGDDESDDDLPSDPEERQRQKEERRRQEEIADEEERRFLKEYYEYQEKAEEFRAAIDAKWESFGQGDRQAIPHSTEWNKANLTGTRDGIEVLIRQDGKEIKPGELQYTVRGTPLPGTLNLDKEFRVILGDLGFALPFNECSKSSIKTEPVYRPPEDLLGLEPTYKADIFSAGLLLWRVVMLDELIWLLTSTSMPGYTRCRQLYDLTRRLGPIPHSMRTQWKEADEYIDKDGNALDLSEAEKSIYGAPIGKDSYYFGDIWYRARIQKPFDMSEDGLNIFMDLIQKMLQWEPKKRPDVDEILQHEWFKEFQ